MAADRRKCGAWYNPCWDNAAMRVCVLQVEDFFKCQKIKPSKGFSENGNNPLQKAWMKSRHSTSGYCQMLDKNYEQASIIGRKSQSSRAEIKSQNDGSLPLWHLSQW